MHMLLCFFFVLDGQLGNSIEALIKPSSIVLRLLKSSGRGHLSAAFIAIHHPKLGFLTSLPLSASVPDSVSQCQLHYPRRSFDERPAGRDRVRRKVGRLLPRLHHLSLPAPGCGRLWDLEVCP